ncbi:aspartate/glutamate racemase family protein [Vibrio cyclitrophicus]|uniref:aspartate/glutamate racemase family protein n=1 Tax=Vibrio cyclitrophicus TaxID=47951 RepID=UPI000C83C203|nr:aspartate/glutamate racemase family protein [Vibrio cyclitrophicus]PMJ58624.1 aspartate/glutamate racemase [Vibrio cyclitrophicus]
MKTIGLLGGMSWESTMSYYKSINEGVKANLGGLNSAKICMYSANFDEIERLQHQGRWSETANILSDAALSVEKGGADFILICTNTMHKVVPEIEEKITIPILHIADTTAQILLEQGVKKVGLLGTAFTMEQDFYKARLVNKFGIGVVIPDESDREQVHNIIYKELCRGEVKEESRDVYRQIIEKLSQQGAEAVILGCTEIALLIQQQHTDVPLLDTTSVHADAAVRLALGN